MYNLRSDLTIKFQKLHTGDPVPTLPKLCGGMVKDVQSTTGLEDSMLPNPWKAFICNHTSIVAPKSTCRDKQGTLAGANRDFWDRNSVMRLCLKIGDAPKFAPNFVTL